MAKNTNNLLDRWILTVWKGYWGVDFSMYATEGVDHLSWLCLQPSKE